jgi:hypothetical protein
MSKGPNDVFYLRTTSLLTQESILKICAEFFTVFLYLTHSEATKLLCRTPIRDEPEPCAN